MTGRGVGMTVWCRDDGGGMAWAIGDVRGRSGARTAGGAGAWLLTPHLTSPLEGGRDELGER